MSITLAIAKRSTPPNESASATRLRRFWLYRTIEASHESAKVADTSLVIEQALSETELLHNFAKGISGGGGTTPAFEKTFSGRCILKMGPADPVIGGFTFDEAEAVSLATSGSGGDRTVSATLRVKGLKPSNIDAAANAERDDVYPDREHKPVDNIKFTKLPGVNGDRLDCKLNASVEMLGGGAGMGGGAKLSGCICVVTRETQNDWTLPLWQVAELSINSRKPATDDDTWPLKGDKSVHAEINLGKQLVKADGFVVDSYSLAVEAAEGSEDFRCVETLSIRLATFGFRSLEFKDVALAPDDGSTRSDAIV